jgi:hypothetical protein
MKKQRIVLICTVFLFTIISLSVPVHATVEPDYTGITVPEAVQSAMNDGGGASLWFNQRDTFKPNGRYLVSVLRKDRWVEAGEIQADKHLRMGSVDLTRWIRKGAVRVRIEQEGGGAAHMDSVLLGGRAPETTDAVMVKKLSIRDNDVIDVFGKTLEFVFKDVSRKNKPCVLEVTARIESEEISKIPFHFPLVNLYRPISADSSFYTYTLGSSPGRLDVDGAIESESLGEPFFTESWPSGSGHPNSPFYGWVFDDGENLYAAIDVTGDNTIDGDKDYTKIYAKTREGVKEFTVTAVEERWGKAGFVYTERAGWQHKVYEFMIPLNELGKDIDQDEPLKLAFASYGTMVAIAELIFDGGPNGVDPVSGPAGTKFTFTVLYRDGIDNAPPSVNQVWIDLDGDGEMDTAGTPFVPFWKNLPPFSFFLLASAGLLFLFCIVFPGLKRAKLRILFPALILLTAVGLVGCPVPPPEYTTVEVYDMTWVDSVPGETWDTGEDFSADVTINAPPGVYTFRFNFETSVGALVTGGSAAVDLTLTIE